MRFTVKDGHLYTIVMAWPQAGTGQPDKVSIKTLRKGSQVFPGNIAKVELLGGGTLKFEQQAEALNVTMPKQGGGALPLVLKISPDRADMLKIE